MRTHYHPRPSAGLLSYMQPFPEDKTENGAVKRTLYDGNKNWLQKKLLLVIFLKEIIYIVFSIMWCYYHVLAHVCFSSCRDFQRTTS